MRVLRVIVFIATFSATFSAFSQQTAGTAAELKDANTEIGFLSGEKGSTVPLLATVKQEIADFKANVLKPHNDDAENQNKAMRAAEAAPYDPYDATSVANHNAAINAASEWGRRVEERKARETPRYREMLERQSTLEQKLADLETKIKEIIRRFNPNCDAGTADEALVNCWAMFFDGESKRKALGDDPVYPGTNFFSSGVPKVSSDAFKTFRNEQLDKINRGINKIDVPKPPPPPQGMIEKATEKVKEYFNNLINQNDRYRSRRTATAVLAVRG